MSGDFISSHNSQTDYNSQLQQLRNQVRTLVPIPTSQHEVALASIPNTLQQAKFVFIRRDAHRTPLQHLYEGPFKVLQPGHKTFKIDIGGQTEKISIDRLKPAHSDLEQPVQVAQPRPRGQPKKYQAEHTSSRSQTCPILLYYSVPDRAVKSNRHIVTSLCLRGEWCSGRDLRHTEVQFVCITWSLFRLKNVQHATDFVIVNNPWSLPFQSIYD